jgi:hypothetical protein
MNIFAFTESDIINYNIIKGVLSVASKEKISENYLKGLFIHTNSETIIDGLTEQINGYRYNLNYFCEADLAARKLFEEFPLYEKLTFNKNTGLPKEKKTLKILILGFGVTGKEIMRQAIYNGQFEGCSFEAIAVDRYMKDMEGKFKGNYPALFSEYKPEKLLINLVHDNVRSDSFYRLLQQYIEKTTTGSVFQIDYIVASLGDDNQNFEAVTDIKRFLIKNQVDNLPTFAAHIADKKYKLFNDGNNDAPGGIIIFGDYDEIFTHSIIINEEMDILAKAVDTSYGGKDWAGLSIFLKNSNRALASFMDAFLYILGLEKKTMSNNPIENKKIRKKSISETDFEKIFKNNMELLKNMSRTEHLRWSSFHYAFGWTLKTLDKVD